MLDERQTETACPTGWPLGHHRGVRRRAPSIVTCAELLDLLGAPSSLLGDKETDAEEVPLIRLELEPGDVLYSVGSEARYAYIVESGLMLSERVARPGERDADVIGFASARDLLGINDWPNARREAACALSRTSLLALPIQNLRDMEKASPFLAELFARSVRQALVRDRRIIYGLRELPPYTRTVAALSQLMRLALSGCDLDGSEEILTTQIGVPLLGRWLGLFDDVLAKSLAHLERYGALSRHQGHVDKLVVPVLQRISSASPKTAFDSDMNPFRLTPDFGFDSLAVRLA